MARQIRIDQIPDVMEDAIENFLYRQLLWSGQQEL